MPAPDILPSDVGFAPSRGVTDPLAAWWLRQVVLRLRREIAWLWVQRGLLEGAPVTSGALPPPVEPLREALNLAQFEPERRAFFETDDTGRYLSAQIAADEPAVPRPSGPWFSAVAPVLSPVERFALALALAARIDPAIAPVIAAAAAADHTATAATPALAFRLFEAPTEAWLALFDPAAPLARSGLMPRPEGWTSPLEVGPMVAHALLTGAPPDAVWAPVAPTDEAAAQIEERSLAIARLSAARAAGARVVQPIAGPEGAPLAAAAAHMVESLGLGLVSPAPGADAEALAATAPLLALADRAALWPAADPPPDALVPPVLFRVARGDWERTTVAEVTCLPTTRLAPLSFSRRLAHWRGAVPGAPNRIQETLSECARRFRLEASHIDRSAAVLAALGRTPSPAEIFGAARSDVDLGRLAQPILPRFDLDQLVLPAAAKARVAELVHAVMALARVQADWGVGENWGETGLSALFVGPPGTGKTMAAQAIAQAAQMPLYRVDLSQVVDKYIGETEKNLARLFDGADRTDAILFFDEADALFARRTDIKSSNDRYANMQVNYLLQRIEAYQGLAILATNRRKDVDEAFLRRLRLVVEFPTPAAAERLEIWRKSVPAGVDAGAVEFAHLAGRLALTGGHIRSIILNACLQCATPDGARVLTPKAVVRATQRELEKLARPVTRDQFGVYASLLETSS